MPLEIERKFRIKSDAWREQVSRTYHITQAYPEFGPRVRIRDTTGFITIKHRKSDLTSYEWEYEIPLEDAEEMISLSLHTLSKKRHLVKVGAHTWEVDEFLGDNKGLIVAEIELKSEDEPFEKPEWLAQEVSGQKKYINKQLAKKPFNTWDEFLI